MDALTQIGVFIILLVITLRIIKHFAIKHANEDFDAFLKKTGQTKEEFQARVAEELDNQ